MSKREMSSRFASSKAKKGKRKSQSQRSVPSRVDSLVGAATPAPLPSSPAPAPSIAARKPAQKGWMPPRAARGQSGLITDYSYVSNDLKQIAMTAAAMFAIIGGLAFVIR